jgi:hypothetical protein
MFENVQKFLYLVTCSLSENAAVERRLAVGVHGVADHQDHADEQHGDSKTDHESRHSEAMQASKREELENKL